MLMNTSIASKKRPATYAVLLIALAFATIGAVRLLTTHAATTTLFGEAENSTPSGSYTVHNNDTSASGNGYITLNSVAQTGCGSGGTCTLADIQTHTTSTDCRSAINIDNVVGTYAIPDSWLTIHRDNYKNIVTKLCGKVFGSNLHAAIGEHHDGTTYNGMQMIDWVRNFYIGPYQ